MPKGRFISRKVAIDPKLNQLDDTTFLFYLMLIPHLDAEGRMWGDAVIVKGTCCPHRDWAMVEVENMLSKLESIKRDDGIGIIERYSKNGHSCLWMAGFEGEQKGLQKHKEATGKYGYSDVPPPPTSLIKLWHKTVTESKPQSTKAKQPIDKAGIDNETLASMVAYWEGKLGQVTPNIFETLKLLCDEHGEAEYQRAVDQAVDRKARSPLRYIEKILLNKANEGKPEENPEAEKDWK